MVNKSSANIKTAISVSICVLIILTASVGIVTPVAGMTTFSETSASPSSFLSSSVSNSIGHSACDNQPQSRHCRDSLHRGLDSVQPISQSTIDSDGDGINNTREQQLGTDPNNIDSDNDGIGDATETNNGQVIDTDGDGTIDALDRDSDDDGIPDTEEGSNNDGDPSTQLSGPPDTDSDGIPDFRDADSDDDGINDSTEGDGDRDNDRIPNYRDSDADGDQVNDTLESSADTDADGLANFLDADSDGDNINDTVEANATGGIPDIDGDGTPELRDTDRDGIPDIQDTDSDDDGIPDVVEGTVDTDSDGIPNYRDRDSDGDANIDSDGDGDINQTQIDIDGDGDVIRGKLDASEGVSDIDSDGTPNYRDPTDSQGPSGDRDGDGLRNSVEQTLGTDPRDRDTDGDGISDQTETDGGIAVDTDSDGTIDALDTDSDDDGISDSVEGAPTGGTPSLADTTPDSDIDGISDFRDTDSDDDGCPDSIEGTADVDNDGTPNYRDSDSLGRGCPARNTPTPTPTPTPTDTPTPTPTPTPTDTPTPTSTPDGGDGGGGGGDDGDGGDDDDSEAPQIDTPRDETMTDSGELAADGGGAFGVGANVTALPSRNESPLDSATDETTGTPIGVEQTATSGGGQVLGAARLLQPESGVLYPIRIRLAGILWPLLLSLIPVDIFYRAQRRYHQLDLVPGQPSISERRGNIPWLLYLPVATFFTTRVSLRLRQGILKLSNILSRRGSNSGTDSMESLSGEQQITQSSDIEIAFDSATRHHLQYLTLRLFIGYLASVLIVFALAIALAQVGIIGLGGAILTTAISSVLFTALGYSLVPSRPTV